MRRALAATALTAALSAGLVPVGGLLAPVKAQTSIEGRLPPGTQQVLAAVRVLKGLGARNRVYREADAVQRDLRAYYDQRIEAAQQQLVKRQQVGLRESQVQAYTRVKARLEAEREAALAITEDEKRSAKLAFESRLRQQVLPLIAETRRGRQAVGKLKETAEDLRAALERAREASDLRAALAAVEQRVARLEELAELAELLPGGAGRRMGALVAEARRVVDETGEGLEQATATAGAVIERLDAAVSGLEAQTTRRPISDQDVADMALEAILQRIFVPGGETPTADVIAAAILGGLADPHLLQNLGIATGALDPEDLATMWERVRAAILRETLSRIARQCGRLTGTLHRAAVDAALAGDDLPDRHPPCALLRDSDRLAALLEDFGRPDGDDPDDTDQPAALPDGVYSGEFDLQSSSPTLVAVNENEVRMVVDGGRYTISIRTEYVWGPCPETSRTVFDGQGELTTNAIVFRGTMERGGIASGCESGPFPFEAFPDYPGATVYLDRDVLEGVADDGNFRLVPMD